MVDLDQLDDKKLLYSVQDLEVVFGIGKTLAYRLIHIQGFPKIRINGRYYFPKDQLQKWISANINKNITV